MTDATRRRQDGPTDLPAGTVSFLFTDIEGSTHLLQKLGDRYPAALDEHFAILRAAVSGRSGIELGTAGDALFVVFERAADALAAAVQAQLALRDHAWPGDEPLRVRMGIHTGEATVRPDGYTGLAVNLAARLCAAGHGAQILISEATRLVGGEAIPDTVGLRDLGFHRLKDLPEPERLYQVLHPDLPSDFPGLRLDAVPGNLPKQITTFVGRRRERAAAAERLRGDARLVTLTGSGGCGKTRLALQVAADVVDDYSHGAWLIELADIQEPHLVGPAVAAALDVREEAGRPLLETIAAAIGGKRLLLILDNCEHLVAACADVAEALLMACPALHVLASSQEALGVLGETVLRVPPLSFPPAAAAATPDALRLYESVELFVDRATRRRPGFHLTADNADAVAQICRRLDGIPLAIELAAARITVLSPQQIAARLDDQFRLLTGGSRSALPRQQTLRAAVEWSDRLLAERDRRLLRLLSVFAGGWTLEAAIAVCGAAAGPEPLDDLEMLDLHERLVARSLVVVEEQDGASRYRLLETIRQFAREKLIESGDVTPLRSGHLDWCTALAAEAEPKLTGPDQGVWLARLATEYDNLRTAMEWAASHPSGTSRLLWLTASLWRYWLIKGEWTEGRAWLDRALAVTEGERSATRARALAAAGDLATEQADYETADPLLRESLTIWDELGDQEGRAKALNHLGNLACSRFDYESARRYLNEALDLRRRAGNDRGMAVTLRNLGSVAALQRDHESAQSLYTEALALARGLGEKRVIATLTHALSEVLVFDGDWASGRALAEEGLVIARDLGDKQAIAEHLVVLAGIDRFGPDGGEDSDAAAMLAEALDLWQALGSRDAAAWAQGTLGGIALAAGDVASARDHYEAALARWREVGDIAAVSQVLNLAGWAAMQQGDLAHARAWLEEAIPLARKVDDPAQLSSTLHSLAELARIDRDLAQADELAAEAIDAGHAGGWTTLRWWPALTRAAVARERGDIDTARSRLAEAAAVSPSIGRRPALAAMLEEAAALRWAGGQGDAVAAAHRLGAAAALRDGGAPLAPVFRAAVTDLIAAVGGALGDAGLATEMATGAGRPDPAALVP